MRFPGVGVVPIRWYWTDKPLLGLETIYDSHNHSREEGWDDEDTGEPGEVWGSPRVYDKGEPPGNQCCTGPRGSDAAWVGENDASDPLYLVPLCIHLLGFGGFAFGGSVLPLLLGSGGYEFSGQGQSISTGSGGIEWAGSGRLTSVGSGGMEWAGNGYSVAVSGGGLEWAGKGEQSLLGSGGVEWAGDGRRSEAGSGGCEWSGNGHAIARGAGGLEWAGTGREAELGSDGVEWDGSGSVLHRGSGGCEWAGAGVLSLLGNGGVEWAGTGTEVEGVTTFDCSAQVAAGSTQGTATLISHDTISATSTGANQGLILPAGCYHVTVFNANSLGGNTINVYPPSGAKINPGVTNAASPLAPQACVQYVEITATLWRSISLT
jgi:hypothetical protein